MQVNNLKYLKQKRRDLRNDLTSAEATMWRYLQHSKLDGRKFRRQHSVGNYMLDFYCPSEKLAIELDGSSHDDDAAQSYDKLRTTFLNRVGIKVIRFQNDEVFDAGELICDAIKSYFTKSDMTTPNPS